MMAVAVDNFQNFLWSRFLIIRQNVNMAPNTILNCGLTPNRRKSGGHKHGYKMLICLCFGRCY